MILEILSTWKIAGIISVISLIVFLKSQNSIWGGFTIGGFIGLIAAFFREGNYSWHFVAKFAIIGTLTGLAFELYSLLYNSLNKKRKY